MEDQDELPICDVCGIDVDSYEGLLRFETDTRSFGGVCSWFCAAQFSIAEASKQRERLVKELETLKKKSEQAAIRKQMYGFIVPH